jgi:hypothetical protein
MAISNALRHPIRDVQNIELKFNGIIEKTKYCQGPEISTNKGNDFPCCCSCDNLRNCSRRDDFYFSSTCEKFKDYIDMLKRKNIIKDLDTSYSLSTCGNKIFFIRKIHKDSVELEPESYIHCIIYQFQVLKEMGYNFNHRFSLEDISLTKLGIPIIFPNFEKITNSTPSTDLKAEIISNDEGSKKNERYLKFSSPEKIIDDKKFSHYYVFGVIMDLLLEKNNFFTKDNFLYYPLGNLNFDNIEDNELEIKKKEIKKIPGNPDDKYVILDLDSTLIFSSPTMIPLDDKESEKLFFMYLISRRNFFKTKIRNHLNKFLEDLINEGYKLIIWSAGCESYVKIITSILFKDIDYTYVFTSEHVNHESKKILMTIENFIENFDIKNCRLIDDSTLHAEGQEDFFIKIPRFDLSNDDDVLENFVNVVNKSFGKVE